MIWARARTTFAALFALSIAGLIHPAPAGAQGPPSWRLTEDNGNLAVWVPSHKRTDDNYTQGLRLQITTDHVFGFLSEISHFLLDPLDTSEPPDAGHYEIGQEIYTPPFRKNGPLPSDRPYAGWLYARAASDILSNRRDQSLGIDVGVIGPPSLAGPTQNAFHAITGTGPQESGWAHQLQFEPGVILRYEDSFLLADWAIADHRFLTIVPHGDLLAGNVYDRADIGVTGRLGWGLSHPWSLTAPRDAIEFYVTGSLNGSYVLRNLFLDGSTFRPSPRVHALALTSEHDVGAGVRILRFSIEVRATTQAREYVGGPDARRYGSIAAGLAW
jgi:lipid A 3-O-deacylase